MVIFMIYFQRIEPADAHVLEKFLKADEVMNHSKLTNGTLIESEQWQEQWEMTQTVHHHHTIISVDYGANYKVFVICDIQV